LSHTSAHISNQEIEADNFAGGHSEADIREDDDADDDRWIQKAERRGPASRGVATSDI